MAVPGFAPPARPVSDKSAVRLMQYTQSAALTGCRLFQTRLSVRPTLCGGRPGPGPARPSVSPAEDNDGQWVRVGPGCTVGCSAPADGVAGVREPVCSVQCPVVVSGVVWSGV